MPKHVSILIPTYNGEKYISETIDSCLQQSYKHISIMVIDDCSTDDTLNILMSYGDKIQLTVNTHNLGIVKNINKITLAQNNPYFILLGHDDILPKEHVETMVNCFENDVVSVHCNSTIIDANGIQSTLLKKDHVQIRKSKNCMYALSLDNFISSCGMMHRTEAFHKIGGWDENYEQYGEWLYYIKELAYGRIVYTTKTKAFYRRHETNITNTFKQKNIFQHLTKYKNTCRDLAFSYHEYNIVEYIIFYLNRKMQLKDRFIQWFR